MEPVMGKEEMKLQLVRALYVMELLSFTRLLAPDYGDEGYTWLFDELEQHTNDIIDELEYTLKHEEPVVN